MRRAGAPFDFVAWFGEYVMSAEAGRRVGAYCRRYGLTSYDDVEDVRGEWYLKVLGTLQRSGLPATLVDDEQAVPYVLTAAKRVAFDLARRGFRSREEVTERDVLPPRLERHANGERAEAPADPMQWLERVRSVVTGRFTSGAVACSGCTAAAVVQYALAVAALIAEEEPGEGPEPGSSLRISGGATKFARYLYEVIERVHPDRFEVDDEGRVAPRTRAYKKRCEPCVIELLLVATGTAGHADGEPDVVEAGLQEAE